MKKTTQLILGFAFCLLICLSATAFADIITLTDLNSTVVIDTSSQAGATDWIVDGRDYLYQQWFWYRIGSTGPEQSIDTLTLAGYTHSDNILTLNYASAGQFYVDITYTLFGGTPSSYASDMSETIRVRTASSPLDFHFFQYSDFDLNRWTLVDNVDMVNANTVRQQAAGGPLPVVLNETVVTPPPSHVELNYYAGTLDKLDDLGPTTLNDVNHAGPGDVTWAFEWDQLITDRSPLLISKDKQISPVPEPASMLLLGGGLLGVGLARLFGKRKP